jgi:hypothetical protein
MLRCRFHHSLARRSSFVRIRTTIMVTVLTADKILRKGLVLVGYDCRRQDKVSRATNLGRFRAHYRSNPVDYAQIWEYLQITATPEARIESALCSNTDADHARSNTQSAHCYNTEGADGSITEADHARSSTNSALCSNTNSALCVNTDSPSAPTLEARAKKC